MGVDPVGGWHRRKRYNLLENVFCPTGRTTVRGTAPLGGSIGDARRSAGRTDDAVRRPWSGVGGGGGLGG